MLRSVTLCAIPSSHFTGFDEEIAEMILGKDSDDSCLKDDDHGVTERTIEAMTKVKEETHEPWLDRENSRGRTTRPLGFSLKRF